MLELRAQVPVVNVIVHHLPHQRSPRTFFAFRVIPINDLAE
jgi:hypothetical protein